MEEYSSSIKIQDSSRMQFLYASQNYGSFYCVFSRFHIENNKLKTIDFEIINYKGMLNMGFLGNASSDSEIFTCKLGQTLLIGLPLKASSGHNKTEIHSHNFCSNNEISIDDITHVFVFRGLLPMDLAREQFHNHFDNEFFYREGSEDPLPINDDRDGYFTSLGKWKTFLNEIKEEVEILKEHEAVNLSYLKELQAENSQLNKMLTPSTNCRVGLLEVMKPE